MKFNNDYSKYLDPSFISKFNNLEISTNMILKGFMIGIHESPLTGFSAEFSTHKQYSAGDPIKNIDWKVYGRTEKYYLKQYEDETNIYSYIFVDFSKSMCFKSEKTNYSKIDYARQLAAAISYLLIMQKDAVALGIYSDKLNFYLPPKSNITHLHNLLIELNNSNYYQVDKTFTAFDEISLKMNKAGIAVIISDFLEDFEKLSEAILSLKRHRNDVMVFMIADQNEYNFDFNKNYLFKDMETKKELEVYPKLLKKKYRERYDDLVLKYESLLTKKGVYFKFLTTADPFHIPLTEMLLMRKSKI